MSRQRYRARPDRFVVAVQLKLDTDGFGYRKWDNDQRCKPGDWLVDNDGDVYTVDADSFARTYRELRRGHYVKSTRIWAEQATDSGSVATKEGHTRYAKGDWLVSNNEDGTDSYAISAEKFERLYELDE
ncbi:MAG TPA: hypothetical protein VIO33_02625 [Burkholderiaceae bacterium]